MGAFEQKQTGGKVALPADLPNVATAATEHPDGAIYKADNGKRFRLRHARWVEVIKREPKKAAAKK